MYSLVEFEEIVPIPPEKMQEDPRKTCWNYLVERYANNPYDKTLGIVVALIDLEPVGDGVILHGDPNIYQKVHVTAITYRPENKEVFNGIVSKVTEYGLIVDFGAGAGFLHISQIADDRFDIDTKSGIVKGRETKWIIRVGDILRTRINSISEERSMILDTLGRPRPWRIGLTCRSLGLGKLEWIREEKENGKSK